MTVTASDTEAGTSEILASPEVTAMLEDRLAALNSHDPEAIAAFYTADAVLEERDLKPRS